MINLAMQTLDAIRMDTREDRGDDTHTVLLCTMVLLTDADDKQEGNHLACSRLSVHKQYLQRV